MHAIVQAIRALPFTTVAAINATLSRRIRVALAWTGGSRADSPSVRIGLPEVQIGLLPAAAVRS